MRDNESYASVREDELKMLLDEVKADYRQGRFVVESVEEHVRRIKRVETTEHGE
jgi:hypothetical protein